ncbi:ankyrin repeat domain-containing protein [Mycobacteroides chelonae]|uniref:ankyrin repeat domain-containing protein n=1 Tax=Mycobacteroides chelonae TaxID=1774 RepID=UPI000A4B625B|nr:ankyrin repeat domain-containing protein [Mycobacteroides chelonae]GLE55280.1 hypothetical protein NJBCHELONAE_05910 [Mycobacteroides chelonae]
MASLTITAKRGSLEQFLADYNPLTDAASIDSTGRTLLFESVANRDINARVAITNRLLDDGADPSVKSGGINVLHVLFGRPGHDSQLEAPVLRRLIQGGADVNLTSKRYGPPLIGLIEHGPMPESAMVPFYDAFFEASHLDLSVQYGQETLREFILRGTYNLPILRERVLAYEGAQNED